LTGEATVGLWTIGGTLLEAVTIPTGTNAPEQGGFRWKPTATLRLQPGFYVVAAYEGGPTAYFGGNATNMISTIPGVAYVEDRFVYGEFQLSSNKDFPGYTGWWGGSVHVQSEALVIIEQPVSETVSVGIVRASRLLRQAALRCIISGKEMGQI